ncbi:MAG: cysteine hydrolase family protein [Candidatus Zipacnadales bacterium]
MLKMHGRYYRTIPLTRAGYEEVKIELDPLKTALVVMHCWNIGCEDGPAIDPNFWVGMGALSTLREAERIMREHIRPAMDAARKAGVVVAHVESATIAARHPEAQQDLDPPSPAQPSSPPVVPGWRENIVWRSHGKDYATLSPYARMDRAQLCAPLSGEIYVYQTGQFDRQLRKRNIENLIYTGFATDMCLLRAPGGIELMAPYGYRIYLLRDATLGVELEDHFEERIATRWGIGYFETHYGDSLLTEEFIRACEASA